MGCKGDEGWSYVVSRGQTAIFYRAFRPRETRSYVTGPDKTSLIALFCISRNTNFNIQCTVLLWWLDIVTPDILQLYNKCSYIAIIS